MQEENNNYEKSPDNFKAMVKEILRVPSNILETF